MKSSLIALLSLILFSQSSIAQKLKKADRAIANNLKTHVAFLGSAELNGRRAGTEGETLAGNYISKYFERYGLRPAGSGNSWFQTFEIYDGKEVLPATELVINGDKLEVMKDFFPLPFSANGETNASAVAVSLAENGVPWFDDIRHIYEDSAAGGFSVSDVIRKRAIRAASKGATALILYNSASSEVQFDNMDPASAVKIPVIYLRQNTYKKYLNDESAIIDIKMNVALGEKKRISKNIIGFADNGADSTVIAGATLNNENGIAALIEVARLIKTSKQKPANYLFIAYSGEQDGKTGSAYFRDHPSINLQKVHHRFDIDSIIRLEKKTDGLNLVKRSAEMISSTR